MFQTTGPHYCPECKGTYNGKGFRTGIRLALSADDYSGCGVDMANCPQCGKGFQISYKVDKITRAQSWDIDMEAERKALERVKKEAEYAERAQYDKLKAKFEGKA